MVKETAAATELSAAAWAAKVDRGLSAAEEADFDDWCAGDVRRPGAYARMRAIALHTERAAALGPAFDPTAFANDRGRRSFLRRGILIGGAGLAAAGLIAFDIAYLQTSQHYRTRKGEMRQIALADGSVVTLNTASELEVHFTNARRDLRLIEGEALFDVAHDAARPFYVTAGSTLTRAVGTSFSVLRLPGRPEEVLVREGVVEVSHPAAPTATLPVRLAANRRVRSTPNAADPRAPAFLLTTLPPAELHQALAWREGRIAFEGETLRHAAAAFARYSDVRIVVDDPALGREEIAGLYQANDPVGFAKAVAMSLGARAEVRSNEVRIER